MAIKVLPPDLTRDDTAKQRFLQEAKAASALDHPNICTIHEIDETPEGQMLIAMGTGSLELGRSGEVKCRQISEGWGVEEVAASLLRPAPAGVPRRNRDSLGRDLCHRYDS